VTTTTVSLRVEGVDLNDVPTLIATDEHLDDMQWASVDGLTTATIYVEDGCDRVCAAIDAARRIRNHLPNAQPLTVHEELVSATDISQRVGVSRETVRTWVEKLRATQDFPIPRGSVGGGTRGATKIWAWADIVTWLRDSREIDMDESFPGRDEIAEINVSLARVLQPVDHAWHAINQIHAHAVKEAVTAAASPAHVLDFVWPEPKVGLLFVEVHRSESRTSSDWTLTYANTGVGR